MNYSKLLFIVFFISLNLNAQTQDGLLKNGRSVSYYNQKGQLLRELQDEENEYAQISYAKVINSFGTVKINDFTRTGRYSIDAEDLKRSKTDDVQKLPTYLPATLTYTSTDGTDKIHIQLYINPKPTTINSANGFKKLDNLYFSDTWQTENYSTTTTSGVKYEGPATFILLGDYDATNITNQIQVKGKHLNNYFLQLEHIIICILAPDTQAQEILETMNHDRLKAALSYDESWP
ncbi:MAG TPA: hypothetical protein VLZ75_12980 [Chitinophagales bacterium]|nr:hypothetical protein [Chitinophagales bacterium]